MATHEVDDRSSEIAYSQPRSGHHWSQNGSAESYSQTLSLTRTRGATARITFQGTRIQVMGLVSPSGTGSGPASTYELDNRPSYRFTATQESSPRARVLFYDSGEIDAGSHTLIVTNDVEGSYFWIDSFIITENPVPEPDPQPPSQPAPVSNPPTAITTPNSNASQAVVPPAVQSPSGFPAAVPSLGSQSSSTMPKDEDPPVWEGGTKIIVTTRDSAPSGAPSSPMVTGNASASAKNLNVGVIVGGVLGGLIILLLSVLIVFLLKRKRKPKPLMPENNAIQYQSSVATPRAETLSDSTSLSPTPVRFASEKALGLPGHHPQLSLNSTAISTATTESSRFHSIIEDIPPPSYHQAQGQSH